MTPTHSHTAASRRWPWLLAAVLAVVLVVAGVLWARSGQSPQTEGGSASSPAAEASESSESPAAEASVSSSAPDDQDPEAQDGESSQAGADPLAEGEPLEEQDEARRDLQQSVEDTARILSEVSPSQAAGSDDSEDGDGSEIEIPTDRLEATLMDSALAEAEAEYGEMAVNGWRMEGTPRVVGTPKATATRYREADALRVAACIDSSEVRLVDAQGRTVGAEPRERRALNLFTLVRDGDSWKVAERSLPAETACD